MKPAVPPTGVQGMLLLTTLVWGLNLPVLKWLTGHFDSVLLSGLRMLAAVVSLACLLPGRALVARLQPAQWRQLLLCALLMVYLNQWLFAEGMRRSSATNGALITALHPLLAALLALVLLRERLGGRRLLGVLIGLAGVALAILNRPSAQLAGSGVGDLMVLGGVLLFAIGAVVAQRLLVQVDAVVVSLIIHAAGAACLLVHTAIAALWNGEAPRAVEAGWLWVAVLLSGALSTGMGNLMWNRAIAAIGMARASMWLYWVPIFGIASAVVFLGEPLTGWHLLALAMVLAGTRLGTGRGG